MDEDAGSMSRYLLDPSAQEFRPSRNNLSSNSSRIPLNHQPIYYSHPVNTTGYYDGLANYQEDHYKSSLTTTRYARPVAEVQPLPPLTTAATRALLLTSVPSDVNEMIVRRDMEVFGEIRAIQMERLHSDGIVTIQEQHMQHQIRSRQHYNFLMGATNSNWDNSQHPNQHSHNYQQQILSQPAPSSYRGLVAGRIVWAQFTVPVKLLGHGGRNQGTIVVFNLDSSVSMLTLNQIFEAFGTVKELRETPSKKHQKFIEFYDIRDAARALSEMDGKEIEESVNKMNRNSTTTTNKEVKARSITDAMSILSLNKNKNNDKSGSSSSTDKKKTKNKSKNKTSNGDNYTTTTTEDVATNKEINKSCSSSGSSSCSSSNRSWKSNRQQMKVSSNLLIDEAAIMETKFQKLLLNMLDNHCSNWNEQIKNGGGDQPLSSYDFCNWIWVRESYFATGALWRALQGFHSQSWESISELKKFACETVEYLPVVFSPPRDGKDQVDHPDDGLPNKI
ncbi:hypothetical protein MKX03_013864 [Papaver bracteatum]|nr:hypothetical protein MKX03_013864 [Papaver bracteatum]